MTSKPNLPGYNVSDITQVDADGAESKYESYWAYLKSEDPPADDPTLHNEEQIAGWAKAANPKNVSQDGQGFLDFHNALTNLNFSSAHGLDLPGLVMDVGKQLHSAWNGGATAEPEAQRQLTLLYQSAKDLMDTSLQGGNAVKTHGDTPLPAFKNAFDDDLDNDTAVHMDDWKKDPANQEKYPSLMIGHGNSDQQIKAANQATMAEQTAFRDQWAQQKLAAHNVDVGNSYEAMPFMLDLSFPPGTNVPKPPPSPKNPKDLGQHGPASAPPGVPTGMPSSFGGGGGSPSMPHMPDTSQLAGAGGLGGTHGGGTDLSGVGAGGLGNGGTSLSGLNGPTGPNGTTGLNGPSSTSLGGTPPGLGGSSTNPNFPSVMPTGGGGGGLGGGSLGGLGGGGGGGGGLGSDPLGLKTPGGGSVQEAGGTIGSNGSVAGNTAATAAEEAAMGNAAAASASRGMMPPMMPPMMGGAPNGGGQSASGIYMPEDEDVWGGHDGDWAPPLIG